MKQLTNPPCGPERWVVVVSGRREGQTNVKVEAKSWFEARALGERLLGVQPDERVEAYREKRA